MGSQPLSHELIVALIDSHLFDLVKAVELLVGICVADGVLHAARAAGRHAGLVLRVLLGRAARRLGLARRACSATRCSTCNLLLCLAYVRSYGSMFALRSTPRAFGALDARARRRSLRGRGHEVGSSLPLASDLRRLDAGQRGINHFFLPLWPEPIGHEPLALQFMDAFVHSGLIDVAMAIELVTGVADPHRLLRAGGAVRRDAGVDVRAVTGRRSWITSRWARCWHSSPSR